MSNPGPPSAPPRPPRRPGWALVAFLAVSVASTALGACGDDDDGGGETSGDGRERTTTTLPPMPADFDWWNPTEVALGNDWVLKACEGDDPTLCFEQPDGSSGFVGVFRFDVPPDFDLNAHAARFVEDFRTDRTAGCGAEYRVEAEPIESLELPDGPARRYGFNGGAQNSVDTERTVQWAGVRGTSLVIVTISGYDPGSCVPAVGEATLAEQDEVLEPLEALILAAGLPDPAGAAPPG